MHFTEPLVDYGLAFLGHSGREDCTGLGWRSAFTLFVLCIDMLLVTDFGAGRVPQAIKRQWFILPAWTLLSFVAVCMGIAELTSFAEPWVGPPLPRRPLPSESKHTSIVLFASLMMSSVGALCFCRTPQQSRMVAFAVVITLITLLAHSLIDQTIVLESTYGRTTQ